jgi:hypothetical protein
VLYFESVKVCADAFQESPFALNVEDAQTPQPGIGHAANKLAFADSGSATNRHHEPLLARAAAKRVNFGSRLYSHLSLLISQIGGLTRGGTQDFDSFLLIGGLPLKSGQDALFPANERESTTLNTRMEQFFIDETAPLRSADFGLRI